jgi:hypothetical protein
MRKFLLYELRGKKKISEFEITGCRMVLFRPLNNTSTTLETNAASTGFREFSTEVQNEISHKDIGLVVRPADRSQKLNYRKILLLKLRHMLKIDLFPRY